MNIRSAAIVVAFSLGVPATAAAQTDAAFGAFAALVKRIDNLSIYRMTTVPNLRPDAGTTTSADLGGGVGFELILLVDKWGAKKTEVATTSVPGRLTEIQITSGDTTRTYVPGAGEPPDEPWSLELGFAYNDQPFNLRGEDYEIRGSLRDQPGISLYLSRSFPNVTPYIGLRFSSYNVVGARAFVEPTSAGAPMRVIPVSASAYSLGFVGGLSVIYRGFGVFAESEVSERSFESLQWPDNTPANFPRGLRLESSSQLPMFATC